MKRSLFALALLWAGVAQAGEASVAVAANFTEPATEIAALFAEKTGHSAVLTFGASGQFFTQISQGAPFQAFLSADEARPKKAVEEGFAVEGTVFTYALGTLALWSADPELVKGEETLKAGGFEKIAIASPEAAPYGLAAVQLRLKFTRVVASDDGVISSRTATLGAVVSPGQELFRLIRRNRLEWRAEVTSSELARLRPGTPVLVTAEGAGAAAGTVRVLGPTVDPQSRNALVYVDLPDAARRGLRPGMFARGAFGLGEQAALSLPQEAVALRDGFAYVFRVAEPAAEQTRVSRAKVQLGRRADNRVEILSGLNAEDTVVSAGAAFLADGDVVRVVRR